MSGPETPIDPSTRIMVVDDNPQNLELMQAYLEGLECEVQAIEDAERACEEILRDPPDLLLLDIMMPRLSGYQLCERIKSNPKSASTPVIMVTALGEVGDVERAVDAGADDFLTKPVNRIELLTRSRSLLHVRRLKRQLEDAMAQIRRLETGESRDG